MNTTEEGFVPEEGEEGEEEDQGPLTLSKLQPEEILELYIKWALTALKKYYGKTFRVLAIEEVVEEGDVITLGEFYETLNQTMVDSIVVRHNSPVIGVVVRPSNHWRMPYGHYYREVKT